MVKFYFFLTKLNSERSSTNCLNKCQAEPLVGIHLIDSRKHLSPKHIYSYCTRISNGNNFIWWKL